MRSKIEKDVMALFKLTAIKDYKKAWPITTEIFNFIERTCKWSLVGEYYVTECKHDFWFTDDHDNATDYGFKYCPYCGGKIDDENEPNTTNKHERPIGITN